MESAARASPLDRLAWPRRTARLTLRRAESGDAAAVYDYRRLEPVGRWLGQLQTDPRAWAEDWELRLATTIVVERDGRVIGDTRLVSVNAHAQHEVLAEGIGAEAEIMWAFHPDQHGHGYATEVIDALVTLAFTELGLHRLTACCYAENEPSWRLMERVGMRREGHEIRSTLHRDGTWHDFLLYARLAPGA